MSDLKPVIAAQIAAAAPGQVWVPADFAQLGNRDAVDKTLQRMVQAGDLRRIDRGLYDKPALNRLTRRPATPDTAPWRAPSPAAIICACWWTA